MERRPAYEISASSEAGRVTLQGKANISTSRGRPVHATRCERCGLKGSRSIAAGLARTRASGPQSRAPKTRTRWMKYHGMEAQQECSALEGSHAAGGPR